MHPKARKSKRQQTYLALLCYSLLCMPFYISCGSESQERKTTSGTPATTGQSGTSGGSSGESPDTSGGDTSPPPSTGGDTETYTFKLGAVATKRGTINFVISDGKLVANFDKDWKSEDFTDYKLTLITSDSVKFEKTSDCSEDTNQVKNSAVYFTEINTFVSATIKTLTIESSSCP